MIEKNSPCSPLTFQRVERVPCFPDTSYREEWPWNDLEDPVPHQDLSGLAHLTSTLDVPVAGGEHLYQLDQFRVLFEARAVGIVILDLARVGGIMPWRKIAALAQAYRLPVCGHVVPEVHVHLLAAIPNGLTVEYMPRSEALLQSMPALEAGHLVVPQAPGLGLALDPEAVEHCRVR